MMGHPEVVKSHYKLVLEDGMPVAVFRNEVTSQWYWRV